MPTHAFLWTGDFMHSNTLIRKYYCIYNYSYDKTVIHVVLESEITFANDIVYFGVTP